MEDIVAQVKNVTQLIAQRLLFFMCFPDRIWK